MTVPPKVLELVGRFNYNLDAYKQGKYNETQVRREFIDPFFKALGWDVDNEQGYAEAYKDVVHEDAIKVGRATKAPDYSFRIGGVRKFFVEAKKPSVDIKEDMHPAYQLRRYGWSAKLPLSILTDFEEFAVYDCRIKPIKTDKASKARIIYLTYTEYPQHWEELANIFSREAILKGSFDKYAESKKAKKGTAEVDVAFLQEIERWRELLARNIALRNPRLSRRELNFAVQRTIDRIIFLRICEDRGVEGYGKLMILQNGTQVYERLLKLFYQADDRYNSGIFHFKTERDHHEAPDTLTPELKIDDKVLKDILKNLYYPDSPYEFSVLPSDILGQVYEQFLGKVIRLTARHQAKVEDKPEVKKAGGVYYTPTYIVAYIVKNTVGKLLEGKTAKQAEKLHILDPACGSGSFLLGAYQYLLDWHRDYYVNHDQTKWTKGRQPQLYQNDRGEWKLTINERKRILLNNIYGVDIDSQAVEVTKLSLLLKVLEGEDEQTLSSQLTLFQKRVLPDLSDNIKCGNSLIGSDFYDGKQLTLLDEEEMYRINAFEWDREFPEIMQVGGFDAVIGNPPYVLLQSLGSPEVESYLRTNYKSATYKVDTYQVFIEQSTLLTRKHGLVSLITPNTFLNNKFAYELRRYLLESTEIVEIDLFYYRVFEKASVDTTIIVLERVENPNVNNLVTFKKAGKVFCLEPIGQSLQSNWQKNDRLSFNLPGSETIQRLIEKIEKVSIKLGNFATAYFGIQTHGRKKYVCSNMVDSLWKPVLDGGNINRYSLTPPEEFVCITPEAIKSGGKIEVYEQERIGIRQIGRRPIATLLPAGWYSLNTIYNIYFVKAVEYRLEYVLGLISSNLLGWYWEQRYFDQKKTFPKIKKSPLLSLTIRIIDFSNPTDKARHDKMVELVKRMLDLHKQLADTRIPQAQTLLKRQIEATDRQIDRLVYELYGLTEEEIKIVESGTI